jgi:SWI/SNF-related matrix-associated actin-dependent regulator 1 of chromatin subfamily A
LISLNDIKGKLALDLLREYKGINPYLLGLKKTLEKKGKIALTETQNKYIVDFHDTPPTFINKIIPITQYLGEELQKLDELSFTPEKILIEYILADTDKAYHIYGKLKKNQEKSKTYWIPKTQVLSDPYFEEIHVDVDFDKYVKMDKYVLPDGTVGRLPYEHQKEGIKFLLTRNGAILADDMGLGKAQPLYSKILTPDGWKQMGDIKPNEYVIGSEGKSIKVIGVFPQGVKDVYEVTFSDNTKVRCCDEHLWSIRNKSMVYKNKPFKTLPLKEIMNLPLKIENSYKWYLPIVKPIEFKEQPLPIPIETYVRTISFKSETETINRVYIENTIKNRIELIKGLFLYDAKLWVKSEQLTKDITEIINSLGGTTNVLNHKTHYIIKISLPDDDRFDFITPKKPAKAIKEIKYIGKEETQCISVDSVDNLYVTDHYTLTHNTYQSTIAAIESGAKRILIVCPSSAKITWEREINCFTDKTTIISGRRFKKSHFNIINFDILKNFHTLSEEIKEGEIYDCIQRELVDFKYDLVIVDEAHYLKNTDAIRSKIMNELCVKYGVDRVWLLTGTPVANRPMDYFNLLKLIKSPIADNWLFYAQRYCDAKRMVRTMKGGKKKKIWITDGASNLNELHNKTKNYVLRRLKTEVLDMPEKTIVPSYHYLTDAQWDEYNGIWDEYLLRRKKEGKRGNPSRDMVELLLLRKFIAMSMIPNTIELAENAIAQGHKVIIFTNFTEELMAIHEHFGKESVIHYGGLTDKKKQESVDKFQNNKNIKVFIGNVISAGVNITLTASDITIFNSYDWVPGVNNQCEDRSFRIGQKNNVTVYYQLFYKTVSDIMWNVLKYKEKIIATIVDGEPSSKEEYEDYVLKLSAEFLE